MDSKDRMKIVRIVDEFNSSIKEVQKSISQIFNGIDPPENFQKIFEEWKKKRQLINNLGTGILIFFSDVRIVTFPLKGDLEKDLVQKKCGDRVSLSQEQINELDKKFLDSIHVRHDENSEEL